MVDGVASAPTQSSAPRRISSDSFRGFEALPETTPSRSRTADSIGGVKRVCHNLGRYIRPTLCVTVFIGVVCWIVNKFHLLHILGIMSMAPVVVQASSRQTATIIFLHGLGDTGHGWASSLAAIKPPYAKLICPTAPAIPVTLNMGMRMPSWFDLKSLDPNAAEDEEGIKKSADNIRKMIQEEIKGGIPANRIIVGGFSMGGALALYIGLTENSTLGGIVALSSWLPMHRSFPWNTNTRPPVLQCHGEADPLVLYSFGVMTSAILKSHLPKYTFKSYPQLQHSSSEQEMEDVKGFMKEVLPPA